MRALCIASDSSAVFTYRIQIPFNALKKYGVELITYPFFPSNPLNDDLLEFCKAIARVDFVIAQRLVDLNMMKHIKNACHIMGKPFVYEVDDDYIHLSRNNPAFWIMLPESLQAKFGDLRRAIGRGDKEAEAQLEKLKPTLEAAREDGIARYKEALSLPDLVTVSTPELKNVIYQYNKNVVVLQNNVENVYYEKDYKEEIVHDGKVVIPYKFGLSTIPSFWKDSNGQKRRIVRIGYTGTPSHHEDFTTIEYYWQKIVKKYADKVWFVYLGDPYFYEKQEFIRNRRFYIPYTPYNPYIFNVRNIDVGIAPLLPNKFNMAKSDIKAIEYGSWGATAVLPNYCTYKNQIHGKTCLKYTNGQEFEACLEEFINNHQFRIECSNNNREYVATERLEQLPQNCERRYNVYQSLYSSQPVLKLFTPNKELITK